MLHTSRLGLASAAICLFAAGGGCKPQKSELKEAVGTGQGASSYYFGQLDMFDGADAKGVCMVFVQQQSANEASVRISMDSDSSSGETKEFILKGTIMPNANSYLFTDGMQDGTSATFFWQQIKSGRWPDLSDATVKVFPTVDPAAFGQIEVTYRCANLRAKNSSNSSAQTDGGGVQAAASDATAAFSRDERPADGALVEISLVKGKDGTTVVNRLTQYYSLVEGKIIKESENIETSMDCKISASAVECQRDDRAKDGALIKLAFEKDGAGTFKLVRYTSVNSITGEKINESEDLEKGLTRTK